MQAHLGKTLGKFKWDQDSRKSLLNPRTGKYHSRMGTYGADIQAALVKQVKAEMAARDMKQKAMADKLGMQGSTLSRYLAGERDIPMPVVFGFADALGLSVVELVQRAERRLTGEQVQ